MSKRSRERREIQTKLRDIQEWRESYRQSRLIDQMLVNPDEFVALKNSTAPLLEWLSKSVVIIADDIRLDMFEYGLHDNNWFPDGAGNGGPLLNKYAIADVWKSNLKAPIIPPFQYMFIEWKRVFTVGTNEWQQVDDYFGVLIDASEFYNDDNRDDPMSTFMLYIFPPSNTFCAFIDYDPETGLFKEVTGVGDVHPFENDPIYVEHAYLALKALSMLNCKNIELMDHEYPTERNEAFQRHWGQPLRKFKTLRVKPIGKQSSNESTPKEYQGLMPLHIRRGNFATYTDDAPLFGKYTGTFWRPATAVGEEKRGVVVKDYKVFSEGE